MKIHRTDYEIAARLVEIAKAPDPKNPLPVSLVETSELVPFLSYDLARPYLADHVGREEWETRRSPIDPRSRIETGLPRAVQAALAHKGPACVAWQYRFRAWLWLLGDDDGVALVHPFRYPQFGMPIVRELCRRYGVAFPTSGAAVLMAEGLPCRPACDKGCGK